MVGIVPYCMRYVNNKILLYNKTAITILDYRKLLLGMQCVDEGLEFTVDVVTCLKLYHVVREAERV